MCLAAGEFEQVSKLRFVRSSALVMYLDRDTELWVSHRTVDHTVKVGGT
jgi:hypothetical protein